MRLVAFGLLVVDLAWGTLISHVSYPGGSTTGTESASASGVWNGCHYGLIAYARYNSVGVGGSFDGCNAFFADATAEMHDTITIWANRSSGFISVLPDAYGTFGGSTQGWWRFGDVGTGWAYHPPFEMNEPRRTAFTVGAPIAVDFWTSFFLGPEEPGSGAHIRLISLSVSDEAGNPITDFSYSTASGAAYPFVGGARVPEPATWLAGVSLLPLVALRRRR